MIRRNFLKGVAASLGLLTGRWLISKPEEEIPEYFFDWQKGVTNHPEHEYPPYGDYSRVTLDGRDESAPHITRLMTGKNGWIEYQEEPLVITPEGSVLTYKVYGVVTWEYNPTGKLPS